MSLSENAIKIFKTLYCLPGEEIDDTFRRVANEFGNTKEEKEYVFGLLKEKKWRPNSPVFFNAGTTHKIFSACFVVGIQDSMESIYDIANVARKIFQYGAGIGIPIGNLREKNADIYEGDKSKAPVGKSSGPISFMQLYNAVGETTKSGGRNRRAAILMAMPVWHPDIEEFIKCKEVDGSLKNMNISVNITDEFMQAFKDNTPFSLRTPATGEVVSEVQARALWDTIVDSAHKTADPGVLFIDTINRYNVLRSKYLIECLNPSLIAGTKVITKTGIYPIEQLENKSFDVINQHGSYSPAECFQSGKNKQLYEVWLEGGKKYYATSEHKWPLYTRDGYVKTKTSKLKAGDFLPVRQIDTLGYGDLGTYNDGLATGWNLGDGWITDRGDNGKRQYGFFFAKEDIENGIVNEVKSWLSSVTGNMYDGNTVRNGCMEINVISRILDDKFRSLGVVKKSEGLPSLIWTRLSEDFRRGLIDGLFSSDGCIHKDGRISLNTAHEKLAYDLSDLLGFYGIKVRIYRSKKTVAKFPNGKNYNKTYVCYGISFSGVSVEHFRKVFKLTHKRKNELMQNIPSVNPKLDSTHIRIKKVRKTYMRRDVWDIRVYDDTHTFKLSHVITGNCSEITIPPFGSCTLSAINLHKFCGPEGFDFEAFYHTAYKAMRLMDNLIDVMETPDPRFKEMASKYRQIGIGPMGLADTLYELNLPYDSPEGRTMVAKIIKTMTTACIEASADMAKEKGKFHGYKECSADVLEIVPKWIDDPAVLEKVKKHGLRNALMTTCMPTGTVAISCDTSYGIEPCFGLVVTKTLSETGEKMNMVNPVFQRKYENEAWFTPDLLEKIGQNKGSLKNLRGIPKEVRDVYVVAHDIKAKDRIDMQACIQTHITAAISSTVNLPETATRDEVSEIYRYAYTKGLKGITIYRDGSKKSQPITFSKETQQVRSNFVRPSKLQANVHVVETGNGKMYCTISTHANKPVEIFISMGKGGNLLNTFCEALGRTTSIALQHGVPIDVVIKTMIGINSDRPVWTRLDENDKKPEQILSIPDALAKLLRKYYSNDGGKENFSTGDGDFCSKCGTWSIQFIEGCSICTNCSESKCS